MSVAPIDGLNEVAVSNKPNPFTKTISVLQDQDDAIRSKIVDGLDGLEPQTGVPDFFKRQLNSWRAQFTNNQDQVLLDEVERLVKLGHVNRSEYLHDQVESKVRKIYLELALKGVGKGVSSIQSLLSAQ